MSTPSKYTKTQLCKDNTSRIHCVQDGAPAYQTGDENEVEDSQGGTSRKAKRARRTKAEMDALSDGLVEAFNSGEPLKALSLKYHSRIDELIRILFRKGNALKPVLPKYEVIKTPTAMKDIMKQYGLSENGYLRVEYVEEYNGFKVTVYKS